MGKNSANATAFTDQTIEAEPHMELALSERVPLDAIGAADVRNRRQHDVPLRLRTALLGELSIDIGQRQRAVRQGDDRQRRGD